MLAAACTRLPRVPTRTCTRTPTVRQIVFASVVMSLHLPLALVPLLKMTDSPLKMGRCRNTCVHVFTCMCVRVPQSLA